MEIAANIPVLLLILLMDSGICFLQRMKEQQPPLRRLLPFAIS